MQKESDVLCGKKIKYGVLYLNFILFTVMYYSRYIFH
jgi:hypothetical protein